jgi:hypothetical protein
MSPRARLATSLVAGVAIAVIATLIVLGAVTSNGPPACAGATDATYLRTAFGVARAINVGERDGAAVRRVVATVEGDRALVAAVAAGDLAGVRAQVADLVYNHEHIVRLRVTRGGVVLDDLGGPLVLSPVTGTLRAGGAVVATFELSLQDDAGYRKLVERLVGGRSVIRFHGRTLMSDLPVGSARLPARGAVSLRGVRYLTAELTDGRFPTGTLRIWLLFRAPARSLARRSCAQVAADVLAGVARRAYGELRTGPSVQPALAALTGALPRVLAACDYARARRIVAGAVAGGALARLRVMVAGRVVADFGSRLPLVAPVRRLLRDGAGRVVATAVFAVRSARGFRDIARALAGAPVLIREGRRQLAGSFPGPASLPRSGALRYRGVRYTVASFAARAFPDIAVRVYLLDPLTRARATALSARS